MRAINALSPARTTTPSRTQSQIRLVPEEAAGAAVPVAAAVGADVTVTVAPGLADTVAVRLGKLPIELLMVLPHPASNPAASRVTGRESRFAERRMLILPHNPQAAWLGGFCLRHHRDCAAPRVGSDPVICATPNGGCQ